MASSSPKVGDFDRRVTIQARSESRSASGAVLATWVDVATVWAAIEQLRGRELIAAQAEGSEISGKIRMHYRSGVTSKHRIVYGSRIFDIVAAVDPSDRHEVLELYVREGINEG